MNKLIKKAFTLIELLVVIAIIGILSGLIVVSMGGMTTKATIAKAQIFSNSLRNALMLNLVSEWDLEDGTGQTALDSWNGGNNLNLGSTTGADANDPTWATSNCVSGKCLSFDGTDDYVYVSGSDSASSNLAITGAITLSAWMKFALSPVNSGVIISRGTWSGNGDYGYSFLKTKDTNKIYFDTYSTSTRDVFYSLSSIPDNNWHYIVATWDGTINTNGKKLYIDGAFDNQKTSTISAMGQPAYQFRIGKDGAGNYPFTGQIDEVRVYNAAIPTSQIKEQYYAGLNSLLANGNINKEEYNQRLIQAAINK